VTTRPKPSALKRARGETQATRGVPAVEPAPPKQTHVEPPSWVVGRALEVWRRMAPGLIAAELLADRYAEAFGIYCVAAEQLERAALDLAEHGPVIVSERGGRMSNPALLAFSRAAETMRKAGWEFGLTPSAVTSLGLRDGRASSDAAEGSSRFLS
jgi:P27 family predicted phage terminase small subunit